MQNQNQAAADFRDVRIDNGTLDAAYRIATEMFNTRDFSGLKRYIDDANNKQDSHKRSLGLSMLYGIGCTLLKGLKAAEKAGGVKFSGAKLPTPEEFLYSFKTDAAFFVAQLNSAVDVSLKLGKVSSVMFEMIKPDGQGDRLARSSDAPTKVEIVSMPDRSTTTEVQRDGNGNIKTSVQLEKDAA